VDNVEKPLGPIAMQQLSIGAVARLTHIPTHTLRKWESRHGIAIPERSDSGRRVYTQAHVELLQLVKSLSDNGHALSHLAQLDAPALQELAGLHTNTAAPVAIASLSLVGPNVCWLMSGHALVLHRHPGTLAHWLDSEIAQDMEGLVIESDTLPPDTLQSLLAAKEKLKLLIVSYRYASRRTVLELENAGIVAIHGPIENSDILNQLEIRPQSAPPERPEPRFSNAQLGRIAAMSPGLLCECPNHIAKLLLEITSFEVYSSECVDTDPAEQALHQKLTHISAQARELFEDALVAVATADGIQLSTDEP